MGFEGVPEEKFAFPKSPIIEHLHPRLSGRVHPSLPIPDAIKRIGVAPKLSPRLGGEADRLRHAALDRFEGGSRRGWRKDSVRR